MLNQNIKKIYLILFFIFLFLNCEKDITVSIDNNKKYIIKNMDSKLIINLKSNKNESLKITFVLHDLTDDDTDMPIFKKTLIVYPGENHYVIFLKEIGAGKYGLRMYYHNSLMAFK